MDQQYKIIRKEGLKRRPLWLVYTLYNVCPSLYKARTYTEAKDNLTKIISLIKSSSFLKKSTRFLENDNQSVWFTSQTFYIHHSGLWVGVCDSVQQCHDPLFSCVPCVSMGKRTSWPFYLSCRKEGDRLFPRRGSAAEAVQAQPGSVARSPPITTNTSKKKQPIPYKQYIEYIVHLNAEQVVRMKKTAKSSNWKG